MAELIGLLHGSLEGENKQKSDHAVKLQSLSPNDPPSSTEAAVLKVLWLPEAMLPAKSQVFNVQTHESARDI